MIRKFFGWLKCKPQQPPTIVKSGFEFPPRGKHLVFYALGFAFGCHKDQERKWTGEPYICHPTRVAMEVCMHPKSTYEMVAAAVLHDVVEDCGVDIDTIHRHFGPHVGWYVFDLTKYDNNSFQQELDRLSMIRPEAKIIKMYDRIDNLADMKDAPVEKVRLYCEQSLLLHGVLYDADEKLGEKLLRQIQQTRETCGVSTSPLSQSFHS